MTADVLAFTGNTRLPDDPALALEKAKAWNLERVIVCGWNQQGKFVFGGSHSEIGEALLLLDVAKKRLLEVVDEELEKR